MSEPRDEQIERDLRTYLSILSQDELADLFGMLDGLEQLAQEQLTPEEHDARLEELSLKHRWHLA